MKTINIDDFLNENAVTVTVNGKDYVVRDIDFTLAEELSKNDSDKKAVVSKILNCNVKELDNYGAIGVMKIIAYLNENLLPKVSQ